MKNNLEKKRRFDYKWVVIGVSFLMVFTSLGFCSSPKSLFIDPITEALGIGRTEYSVTDTMRYVATAVLNLFFGTLIAKFGPKKLAIAGFVALISSCLMYAYASNLIMLYIAGALLGVGFAWTSTTMVGYVINIWSKKNKGTIMGAVLASNGLGGAIAVQIVNPIVFNDSGATTYKDAYLLITAILAVVLVLIIVFFKDRPNRIEDEPEEAVEVAKKGYNRDWIGIDASVAVKKGYFYGAAVCIFFAGFLLQSVTGVSGVHMRDVGIDPAFVANVSSIGSVLLALSKFFTGFLYDRCGLRITVAINTVSSVIIMVLMTLLTNSLEGQILSVVYTVFTAIALPLETVMLPIITAELFGERSYSKMLGLIVAINTAGYASGPIVMNLCFDIFGSYNYAFILAAAIMAFVVVGFQLVISAAKRERARVEAELLLVSDK